MTLKKGAGLHTCTAFLRFSAPETVRFHRDGGKPEEKEKKEKEGSTFGTLFGIGK